MKITISFNVSEEPATVVARRLYVSEDVSQLGRMVTEMEISARSVEVDLVPRRYWFRVLAVLESGEEQPWEDAPVLAQDFTLQEQEDTPPAPSEVAVGYVEPTMQVKATQDPRLKDDAPPMIQEVIVGPDESRGRVVQQGPVAAAGPLPPEGQRLQTPAFGVEGGAEATVDVLVRNIGPGGRPGTAVARTIAIPPREGFHVVAIASVSGATTSGLAAPGATDGWEYVATDGLRLKAFPTSDLMDASWTAIAAKNNHPSYYVDNAFIETNEIDLGVDGLFVLEVAHLLQRKTATGWFASRGMDLFLQGSNPEVDDDVRRTARSPLWIGREVGGDGKARRPVLPEDVRIYAIASSTPAFAHARSDYVPVGEGQWLKGRHVRVAIAIVEPFGSYQLISPKVSIRAHLRKTNTVGTGSPEGAVAAVPGSERHRTDGPPWHYTKQSGVGTTGWEPTNVNAWKDPVKYATAAAPSAYTRTGNVITFVANGTETVDGFPGLLGDRILLKDGAAGVDNGIYVVTTQGVGGGGGTPAVWTRAEDADSGNELRRGVAVRVTAGTANGATVWFTTSADPVTINATAITWAAMSVAAAAHAASHQNGGSDEIDVTGLSGLLADDQTPEIAGLTSLASLDRATDQVPVSDASAGDVPKRVLLRDFAVGVIDRVMAQTKVGPSDAGAHTMYSFAVPANLIGSDKRLRLRASGTIKNASGVNRTITLKVKLGGTTLFDMATGNLATAPTNLRAWGIDLEIQEMNATNAQRGSVDFRITTAVGPTTGEAGGRLDVTATTAGTFTGSKDMTSAQTLLLEFTLSASDANLEAALEEAVLELL